MTVTGLGISNQEHLYNRYEVSTNKQGVGGTLVLHGQAARWG